MAKQMTGTVTSDKVDKTIVITVRARKTHPLYKKQYTVNTKFMAHDEKNEARTGDLVIIVETRPVSRRKHFKLSQILEKAGAAFVEADATADVPDEVIEPQAEEPVKAEKKPAETVEKPVEEEETK
jgi:small subunit ribosomal protein S17